MKRRHTRSMRTLMVLGVCAPLCTAGAQTPDTLRLSIGNIRTTEKHVRQVWELLNEQLKLFVRES